MNRASFLRSGLTLAGTAVAGGLLLPSTSGAKISRPRPRGEDISYFQWGAAAELTTVAFLDAALTAPAGRRGKAQRTLRTARTAARLRLKALATPLGDEMPTTDDFTVELPAIATTTIGRIGLFYDQLETLKIGVYLDGVTDASDPGSRQLLGRLIASQTTQLALVRQLTGRPVDTKLLAPISLGDASGRLDSFIRPGESAPAID